MTTRPITVDEMWRRYHGTIHGGQEWCRLRLAEWLRVHYDLGWGPIPAINKPEIDTRLWKRNTNKEHVMAKMDDAKKKTVIEAMWKAIQQATVSAALSKVYFRALVTGEEPDAGVIAGITSDGGVVPGTSGAAASAAQTANTTGAVDAKKLALEKARAAKAAKEAKEKKEAEEAAAKAAAASAGSDDMGFGGDDAKPDTGTEPSVTMEDIMKEGSAYFKKHGKAAMRAILDKYTKGAVQDITKDRWDELYTDFIS